MNNPFELYPVSAPVGSVIAFAGHIEKYKASNIAVKGTTQPDPMGWMLCDGSPLLASQYPELYVVLGDLYGSSGDGEGKTFNLPNMQGQFLRGVGTDSGSTEKRVSAQGEASTAVGSIQLDAFQTHQHNYGEPTGAMPGDKGSAFAAINPDAFTGAPTSEKNPSEIRTSDHETRPTNMFVYYLIKYTYALPRARQSNFSI